MSASVIDIMDTCIEPAIPRCPYGRFGSITSNLETEASKSDIDKAIPIPHNLREWDGREARLWDWLCGWRFALRGQGSHWRVGGLKIFSDALYSGRTHGLKEHAGR